MHKLFVRIRRMVATSALGYALSYFWDPTNGPARRQRVATRLRAFEGKVSALMRQGRRTGTSSTARTITSADERLAAASGQVEKLAPETQEVA